MPAKATDPPTGYREIDRWDGGVGWLAHPEETMRRASHALAADGGVWLVDPLDAPGVDDLVVDYGGVAGVVVLSSYHRRDAAALARRHGVAVHLPAPIAGVTPDPDAPTERVPVGGSLGGYELLEVDETAVLGAPWYEYALYDGGTLVVGESVGGAPYLRVGDERLGVMPLRRMDPPRAASNPGGCSRDTAPASTTTPPPPCGTPRRTRGGASPGAPGERPRPGPDRARGGPDRLTGESRPRV